MVLKSLQIQFLFEMIDFTPLMRPDGRLRIDHLCHMVQVVEVRTILRVVVMSMCLVFT